MLLPKALPDELVFSRLCRHFTLSGMAGYQYLKEIFDSFKISIHPYLNSKLPELALICDETASELWRTQTLLPLFAYYLSKYREKIQDLSSPSVELIRACQLLSSGKHEILSLKFCPECAKEDIKEYGVSYWHRSHQIPGIEACYKHQIWLEHQQLPPRPHIAVQFMPPTTSVSQQSTLLAWQFAEYSKRILNEVTKENYAKWDYTKELTDIGYITESGQVWRKRFSEKMLEFVSKLEYPNRTLLPNSNDHLSYWNHLLKNEGNQSPFKHLLLGFWLQIEGRKSIVIPPCKTAINTDMRKIEDRCCNLLKKGHSMSEVSRVTGKSCCYIKHLALRKNIPVNLEPRVLTKELQRKIIKMAYKGFHRFAIAKQCKISSGSVEMMISVTSGLVKWRQRCKEESKCRRYKAQIVRFQKNNPDAIRQQIKGKRSAAFFWLFLHEKEWLNANLPKPTKTIHKNKVDWHQRDIEVADIAKKLLNQYLGSAIMSRTELDRLLGSHGWLIKYKGKLPITMAVYEQYLKSH